MNSKIIHLVLVFKHFVSSQSFLFVGQQRRFSWLKAFESNSINSRLFLSIDPVTPLPDSTYTQVLSTQHLDPSDPKNNENIAVKLRRYFDDIYADPRDVNSKRFILDPFYVQTREGKNGEVAPLPGDILEGDDEEEQPQEVILGEREAAGSQTQYSFKRTQAINFFTSDGDTSLYDEFIEEITALGRSIGLVSTTPPWFSIYTNGDMQNFHSDSPHGQMAWVFSLSLIHPESSHVPFSGGETMMLSPKILDYWKGFKGNGLETPSITRFIPSYFGRCIVFDPRVPHGVNEVRTRERPNDLRDGRLVLNGWFAEPETIFSGNGWSSQTYQENPDLKVEEEEMLEETLNSIISTLAAGDVGRVLGYLAIHLEISSIDGSVEQMYAVCDTLVADPLDYRGIIGVDLSGNVVTEDAPSDVKLTIFEALKNLYFSELSNDEDSEDGEIDQEQERVVIVPFTFE